VGTHNTPPPKNHKKPTHTNTTNTPPPRINGVRDSTLVVDVCGGVNPKKTGFSLK